MLDKFVFSENGSFVEIFIFHRKNVEMEFSIKTPECIQDGVDKDFMKSFEQYLRNVVFQDYGQIRQGYLITLATMIGRLLDSFVYLKMDGFKAKLRFVLDEEKDTAADYAQFLRLETIELQKGTLEKQSENDKKEWSEPIRISGRFDPSEPVCFAQADTTQGYCTVTTEEKEAIRKLNKTLPDWLQADENRVLRAYPDDYEWWKYRSPRFQGTVKIVESHRKSTWKCKRLNEKNKLNQRFNP